MPVDTVIAGGTVVTAEGMFDASVAIDGDRIVAVGAEPTLPDADTRIDAEGLLVMPGVVDPHVHIDAVPANRAGTYATETAAAALGGVTTVIDFAWQGGDRSGNNPGQNLLDGIAHKRAKEPESHVDYSLHGVLHRETPETLGQIEPAVDAGVTSFKMFMSTYEVGVSNGFIDEAFEHIADAGAVALLHTEDPSVCEARTRRLRREGRGEPTAYPASRPDYAEAMGASAALRMATEAGVQYYGVHTSCRKAAAVIDRYQRNNPRIRAETCTHYTALDERLHESLGNLPLIAPPLRTPDDIDAVFEYLRSGTLSVVSTDHAVYHREYKEVEHWWDSPFGAHSLQRSLPVFHNEAVTKRGCSYPFLVRVMSRNPAATFGLSGKGTLDPGTDADIVVFDPNEEQTITAETNASGSTYSIYEGRNVTGAVTHTFVRGQHVVEFGELVGEPGTGRFLERALPDWEETR